MAASSSSRAVRALAQVSGLPTDTVSHRLMGAWEPTPAFYTALVAPDSGDADVSRPYPFFLAHPRLVRLERSQMLEVEGGSADQCMKLMRHEAAHAIDNAYGLRRRKDWREVFGRAGAPYRRRRRA